MNRLISAALMLIPSLTACDGPQKQVVHEEIYNGPEDRFLIDGWGMLCADPRSQYWRCVADRGRASLAFFTDDRESYWLIAELCPHAKREPWVKSGPIGDPNTLARRMQAALNEARNKQLIVCDGAADVTPEVTVSAQRVAKLLLSFDPKPGQP